MPTNWCVAVPRYAGGCCGGGRGGRGGRGRSAVVSRRGYHGAEGRFDLAQRGQGYPRKMDIFGLQSEL